MINCAKLARGDLVDLSIGAPVGAILKAGRLPFIATCPLARISGYLPAISIEFIIIASILRTIGRRIPLFISTYVHRRIHGTRPLLLSGSRRPRRRGDDGLTFLLLAGRRRDNGLARLLRRRLLKTRRARLGRGHPVIELVLESPVKVLLPIKPWIKGFPALLLPIVLLPPVALAAVEVVKDLVDGLPLFADVADLTTRLLDPLLLRAGTATLEGSAEVILSTAEVIIIAFLLSDVTETNRTFGLLCRRLLHRRRSLGNSAVRVPILPLLLVGHGGVGIAGNAHVLVLAADVDATRAGPGGPAILVPRRILLLRLGRLDVQDLLLLVSDLPLESHDVPPGVLVQPPDAELLVGLHPVEVGVDGLLCLVGAAALLLQAAEERLVLVLELVDGVVDIDAETVLARLDLAIEEADLGLCMMRRGEW